MQLLAANQQQQLELLAQLANQQQQPNPLNQAFRNIKPPEFSGDKSPDELETWVFRMEGYFAVLGAVPEPQKVLLGGLMLKGQAALWWREVTSRPEADRPQTWEAFIIEMKRMFLPLDRTRLAWEKLSRAKQRDRDSVTAYTSYMRSIFFALPNNHVTEQHKVEAYTRGLQPYLREKVYVAEPATFEAAAALAAKHEALRHMIQRPGAQTSGGNWRRGTDAVSHGPRPMELGALQGPSPSPSDNSSKQVVCYRCGKTGHIQRDCPLKRQGNGQGRRPPRGSAPAAAPNSRG